MGSSPIARAVTYTQNAPYSWCVLCVRNCGSEPCSGCLSQNRRDGVESAYERSELATRDQLEKTGSIPVFSCSQGT